MLLHFVFSLLVFLSSAGSPLATPPFCKYPDISAPIHPLPYRRGSSGSLWVCCPFPPLCCSSCLLLLQGPPLSSHPALRHLPCPFRSVLALCFLYRSQACVFFIQFLYILLPSPSYLIRVF